MLFVLQFLMNNVAASSVAFFRNSRWGIWLGLWSVCYFIIRLILLIVKMSNNALLSTYLWHTLYCIIDSSCFIYTGQDVNGSLFLRREEVVDLSAKCLEENSQSKRRSNAQTKENEPPQVKIQIYSYTCRYTRTYNILNNSAVTKTPCNCMLIM